MGFYVRLLKNQNPRATILIIVPLSGYEELYMPPSPAAGIKAPPLLLIIAQSEKL